MVKMQLTMERYNKKILQRIFLAGVDVITTGNHIWDKKGTEYIASNKKIFKTLNISLKVHLKRL